MPLAGKRLSYLETARLAYKVGIPLGEPLAVCVAIAEWESRRYTKAWNFNTKTKDRSYGLWQINMLGKLLQDRLDRYKLKNAEELYDPLVNARVMASISSKGTNWQPWGAYTNGNYRKALKDGRKAVELLRRELKAPPKKPVPVKRPTPKPVPAKGKTVTGVEAMVKAAEVDLGLGEPNHIQAWYRREAPGLGSGYNGNFAWCNAAVTYWAVKSGNFQAVNHGTHYAYTVSHANRFQQHGEWHVGASGIRRGDIVFFDWNGTNSRGAIDHVGICTGTSGSTVYTIEGNISNRCLRKVRYENTIAGYGRPKYSPVPAPPVGPTVSLRRVRFALTHEAGKEPASGKGDVTRMQHALMKGGHLKSGTFTPGVGDPQTKNAYAKYQRSLGYKGADADGVPGEASLKKLGAASKLFRVIP